MIFQNWRLFIFALPTLALFAAAQVFLYRRLVRDLTQRPALRRTAMVLLPGLFVLGFAVTALSGRIRSDALQFASIVLLLWVGFLQYLLMFTLGFEALFVWHKRRQKLSHTGIDMARRELLQRTAAVASASLSVGLVAHGSSQAFLEPEVTEVPILLPNLPPELNGFSIVQLTDIHVGAVVQTAFLDQLVHIANKQKPDLLVITGDLVDGSVANLGQYVARLNHLQSRYGTHFVTGNHDYYSKVEEWVPALEGLGWKVLRNRHVAIGDAASFDLIGVDDFGTPRTNRQDYDLNKAIAGRNPDRASVLLSHQPKNELAVAEAQLGLQLSGHTHGGQLFPGPIIAKAIWGDRAWGLSKVGHTQFYTSRGCGFVGPPVRVGAAPEVVKVILQRA